jgi:hypothetical protein
MKTEFSISKEIADKLVKMLSYHDVKYLTNYSSGFFAINTGEKERSRLFHKKDEESFSFTTGEVELVSSILKNSNEWNFIKTGSTSITLNGIKILCKNDLFSSEDESIPSDYLLSMTMKEFDENFSLFEHTRISRVINNSVSGVSLIFGNKTIKLYALDYATISTANIRGDINEAFINQNFKHDLFPVTLKEDDINFVRSLINPEMKINITYFHGQLYIVNDDIQVNIDFVTRAQTLEKVKIYEDLFKRSVKFITLDRALIFDILHMLSECKYFESIVINFSKGLITLSSNNVEVAKFKDKKIDIEYECELNMRSLYLILKRLSHSATITLRKIIVEPDTYFVISNNEDDFEFLLICG